MKKISVLGSTGSIGTQALEVIRENEDIGISALCAGSNIDLLEKQIREFRPELAVVYDQKRAEDLKIRISDTATRVLSGMEGLLEAAAGQQADIVLNSVVGMIGILPTMEAIKAGRDVALANKETLVCAGHIIMPLVAECGVRLLPVDSEHSAIFQCLQGNDGNRIEKILLTASGGPFRGKKREELAHVTLEDALKHPNWNMGVKVTLDSSTLANKGLEIMEAKHLFQVEAENIQVVVQPKSIIHSMVQFEDGCVMAQLGAPDMKLPIQYALTCPQRRPMKTQRLDFWEMMKIEVEKPDTETFPMLGLAYEACRQGGSLPTVFNAANEKAVELFIQGKLRYLEIAEYVSEAFAGHHRIPNPSVEEILAIKEEFR